MGAQEHEGMDGHAVEFLGLADDAEDDLGELWRGLEQEPALQGAGGDFDEGVFGNETEGSWHAKLSATDGRSCFVRNPDG
jgi:hypothetical protein